MMIWYVVVSAKVCRRLSCTPKMKSNAHWSWGDGFIFVVKLESRFLKKFLGYNNTVYIQ